MFYKDVPFDLEQNIEYRLELRERCAHDVAFRNAVWQACKHDVVFFFSAFCLAEGTLVVTDVGLVPIEEVTPDHLVWDGEEWVSQGGSICQGMKPVIRAYDIELTSDHKVWTKYGWKIAGDRHDRGEVRTPNGGWPKRNVSERASKMALSVPMRRTEGRFWKHSQEREADGLRVPEGRCRDTRENGLSDVQRMAEHDCEVFQSKKHQIPSLWWAWNQGLRAVAEVREFLGGYGGASRWHDYRKKGKRRQLRTEQLQVGHSQRAGQEYIQESLHRNITGPDGGGRCGEACWCHSRNHQLSPEARSCGGESICPTASKASLVYDLINCGPRQAFTVMDERGFPLRVHNCWLFEPRTRRDKYGNVMPKMIPFIPWEHQIPAIQEMREYLGECDVTVFKSRGEGFSWISILLALHDWLFDDMAKVGLVSNTEKKADDPGNMDSLMAKLDWELTKLPMWLAGVKAGPRVSAPDYERNLTKHSLVNLRNGAQINAFAATSDAGRSGRYKWFLEDELAFWETGVGRQFMESVRESTESRCSVSTPNGDNNVFYDMVHLPSGNNRLIRVHWTQNPSKNRGLYKIVDNIAVAVDPVNNPLLPQYDPPSQEVLDRWSRLRQKGFVLEKTLRSDWYDWQCDRPDSTPQSIAQELDLDFGGSAFRVFKAEFFEKARETMMPPLVVGEFSYDPEDLSPEFSRETGGLFRLWVDLDARGRPPMGEYAVGCDIASGLGGSYTSNSTLDIVNINTMEQVASYACNTIEQSEFGEFAVAVAKWWHGAYLNWETNNAGAFTKRVKDLQYGDVYERTVLDSSGVKRVKKVGWHTNKTSKELMFGDLQRKVKNGQFVIRSEDVIRECGEYIRTGSNSEIEHQSQRNTADKSSKGMAHGDRVISLAVALQTAIDRNPEGKVEHAETKISGPAPPNTMAARIEQWEKEDKPIDDWDDRTNADLARKN